MCRTKLRGAAHTVMLSNYLIDEHSMQFARDAKSVGDDDDDIDHVAVDRLPIKMSNVSGANEDMNASDKRRKMNHLYSYAAAFIIPFAGEHAIDYYKNYWRVGGGLRKHLHTTLLRRYLNYTNDSRSKVAIEKLVLAMTRDVVDVVSEAYITILDLVFGRMIRMILLISTSKFHREFLCQLPAFSL